MKQAKSLNTLILTIFSLVFIVNASFAEEHGDKHSSTSHDNSMHSADLALAGADAEAADEGGKYNPQPMIMHHIADANEWHLAGDFSIPLPVIVYSKDNGLNIFMSSKFEHGHVAHNGYVLDHGRVKKVQSEAFPKGTVHIEGVHHKHIHTEGGEDVEMSVAHYEGAEYEVSRSGFLDISITKNVAGLLIAALIMCWLFLTVAKAYKKREGKAPSGLQSFMEPLILFVRDDIARPNLGKHADKYMPYIMGVFFFIWIGNLLGLIPFIGNPNLTGNIAVTAALASFTLLITNFSGNKEYWGHIFNPPGAPLFVKIILIPIEIVGILTKPFALMVRLFANITAGHIIVLSLVSLIFVFGNAGQSMGGSAAGAALAVPFVLFMSLIELLVAFLQAFIFAMLSALFIGLAIEEHH